MDFHRNIVDCLIIAQRLDLKQFATFQLCLFIAIEKLFVGEY